MQIKQRQYPHPVLSYFSDDLINCAFQAGLKITATKTTYIFEAKCRTSSMDIVNLVGSRSAQYAFHIECVSTRYRKLVKSFKEDFSFEIAADELDGKVQICSFILAAEDIPSYGNKNFHPDYEGISFKVKKGDVLALGVERTFEAEKEVDPLRKIPSIFTIGPNNHPDAAPFDVHAGGDKVMIKLSAENFARYKTLAADQNLQPLLASMFILPALISLLDMLTKGDAHSLLEYEECRWFRVLAGRLKNIGIDLQNANTFPDSFIAAAQELIGDPITNGLKTLEEFETDE